MQIFKAPLIFIVKQIQSNKYNQALRVAFDH